MSELPWDSRACIRAEEMCVKCESAVVPVHRIPADPGCAGGQGELKRVQDEHLGLGGKRRMGTPYIFSLSVCLPPQQAKDKECS